MADVLESGSFQAFISKKAEEARRSPMSSIWAVINKEVVLDRFFFFLCIHSLIRFLHRDKITLPLRVPNKTSHIGDLPVPEE